jgi:hypothetical protein
MEIRQEAQTRIKVTTEVEITRAEQELLKDVLTKMDIVAGSKVLGYMHPELPVVSRVKVLRLIENT